MKQEDYQADRDEIDFEFDDEFQDDDEGFVFGEQEDEDTKEIEKKIRAEQRTANLAGTGVKDEDRDYDEEEQQWRERVAKYFDESYEEQVKFDKESSSTTGHQIS